MLPSQRLTEHVLAYSTGSVPDEQVGGKKDDLTELDGSFNLAIVENDLLTRMLVLTSSR